MSVSSSVMGAVRPGILLVEDDDAVRATLADLLNFLGCTVIEARSGVEALQLARRHHHHLQAALIDVNLPGISGREVCTRLHTLLPALPLVIITGYTNLEDLSQTGARYLLEKPFGITTLSHVLQRMGVQAGGAMFAAA